MNDVSVLDCTLRDGGRIIDCAFDDRTTIGIFKQLNLAGIDIIEVGFLRDLSDYPGNSTFFADLKNVDSMFSELDVSNNCILTVFIDHGLYDIKKLPNASETCVKGIRYGFTKKEFLFQRETIVSEMNYIKKLGFKLYLQDVNTPGYSSKELIELCEMVNQISPISFGVVDTYGSMYLDDLEYLWSVVDRNLDESIAVDFHSHNNMEMSFALSQRIIELAQGRRKLIIDATLFGMGKCAGNLKTELLADYLVRKKNGNYSLDTLLDAIDWYIYRYEKDESWGYSIPAFLSGVYKSHPNNMIFLAKKYRLNNRDVRYILSEIDEEKRQRYDYDNIARIYNEYMADRIDDSKAMEALRKVFNKQKVLVLAPGQTIDSHSSEILKCYEEENPLVVSINFIPTQIQYDYVFFANTIHWEKNQDSIVHAKSILSSNIRSNTSDAFIVNYSDIISENHNYKDNSTIMLLNLLKELKVSSIYIAGFDGYKGKKIAYTSDFESSVYENDDAETLNMTISNMFNEYLKKTKNTISVQLITPSEYKIKEGNRI